MANSTRGSTKAKDARPPKPFNDFPLFAHRSGRWAKTIRGKTVYFAPWGRRRNGKRERVQGDGWKQALDEFNSVKDDLFAGRTPRNRDGDLTITDLCNQFLSHCQRKVESGEMVQRTWDDYKRVCDRIVCVLGLSTCIQTCE